MDLPEKFSSERKTVCVQGLGFVGASMALAVASAKGIDDEPLYNVIGIDVPNESGKQKVESINNGIFPFENNDEKLLRTMESVHKNGNFWATTDEVYFSVADVVMVDINLDVYYDAQNQPFLDLSLFKEAIHTFGRHIPAGTLVIVETTVPPGTCEKVVRPILMEEFSDRGLDSRQIYVAHSYERVMPGKNYFDSIVNFWRVYSGVDDESANRCEKFLKTVIYTDKYPLTRLQGTTSTEIAKVLENSYRAATIAFMEEWGRFAEAIDVDLFEIINAIRMRPTHSNMRQPGFGVGGYCLTKDPYFAKLAAKDLFGLEGMDFPFCTMAVETNRVMPLVSLAKIEESLGTLYGKHILVMGVSYRQDVGDTRYSPSEIFVQEAEKKGANVDCQDPMVTYWKEIDKDVLQELPPFTGYDAIVFTVQHELYKVINFTDVLMDEGTLIFDANDVLTKKQRMEIQERNDVRLAGIGR